MTSSAANPAQVWSAVAPLPSEGTWLLEASAGTGKTWQLASLVARLVVEPAHQDGSGLAIGRLLLMTFTRAAAAELRERVRSRLIAVREALEEERVVDPTTDAVLALLVHGPPSAPLDADRLAHRLNNVRRALADFDQATISTIHSFSQGVLDTLAFESGQDTELHLVESTKAIRERLAADAIASRQAVASPAEMARIIPWGWNIKTLGRVADEATRAGAGHIEPPAQSGAAAPWPTALQALSEWWRHETGGEALKTMIRAELAATTCRLNGRSYSSKIFEAAVGGFEVWLDGGAGWSITDGPSGLTSTQAQKLTRAGVERAYKAGAAMDLRLFDELEALVAALGLAASGLLADFGRQARQDVEAALRRRRELSFDAILSRLAERIEQTGPQGALATAIAAQFDAVMVDEFQDTDSAQWTVLKTVFHGRAGKLLFLVGDPKQAIYAFRGADVHVYLAAKASIDARRRFTMTRNYRSDEGYILALNRLWGRTPGAFGALDMDYVSVDHKPEHAGWALRHGPPVADLIHVDGSGEETLRPRCPLELRWLDDGPQWVDEDSPNRRLVDPPRRALLTKADDARERAANACAAEIRLLLESDARLPGPEILGQPSTRALAPRDFAVLVNSHKEAALVKVELGRHGIMAVAGGKVSVFQSRAAEWLLDLLDAIATPNYEGAARRLAICPLFGWSLAQLERALEEANEPPEAAAQQGRAEELDWVAWRLTLAHAAERWARHRFAGVAQGLFGQFSVIERVLGLQEGERLATDLRHLVELCHTAERRGHLGPVGLTDWLRQQKSAGEDEAGNLRLESDADAVRVVTLHKAKGLQYPIVMLPFAWAARVSKSGPGPLVVHPDGGTGLAIIDLHAPGTAVRDQRLELQHQESRREDLRKLYVALTRAEHHCVAWFGPAADKCAHAALNRLLFRNQERQSDDAIMAFIDDLKVSVQVKDAKKRATRAAARQLAERQALGQLQDLCAEGELGWRFSGPPVAIQGRYQADDDVVDREGWRVAPFCRAGLSHTWQRASFSSMVGGRQVHADEPADPDQRSAVDPATAPEERSRATVDVLAPEAPEEDQGPALPLAEMWSGTVVGTWGHAVLEHLSFQANEAGELVERSTATTTPPRDVATLVAHLGRRFGHRRAEDWRLLIDALPLILSTPLDAGPLGSRPHGLPAHFTLSALADSDRMDELDFDLSLAGGETGQPGSTLEAQAVTEALRPRLLEPGWDGRPWLQTLIERADEPGDDWSLLPRIAGILTGQIDLVFRSGERLYLADYKTNRIHTRGARATRPAHYSEPWLAWAMAGHGYHLQALIYTVAVHRLLADRLGAEYDYDRHFGGHLYLFLRGMTGAEARLGNGAVQGVYADRWPKEVVEALDVALDPTLADSKGGCP